MCVVGLLNEADRAKAKQARRELDRLTATTGGFAYYPENLDEVGAVTVELARQIRKQYTIAYLPSNQALDGRYRTIRVVVKGRGRFVVQTRAGYRAVRQPGD